MGFRAPRRLRLAFLAYSFFTTSVIVDGQEANQGLHTFQGHVYQLVDDPITWMAANEDAQNNRTHCSVPGHLVSSTSQDEQDFIEALIGDELDDGEGFWIGLNDLEQEGNYLWTTGEPFGYEHWLSGEPNACCISEEHCVLNTKSSGWNDAPCTRRFPYIVEFDCEVQSEVFADNGHIYQITGHAKAWNAANDDAGSRTQCGVEGHLVTITSPAEQAFVASLYNQSKVQAIGAWIGLNDFQEEGVYEWVKADDESSNSFTAWDPNEPNNAGESEDCGMLVASTFGWNDNRCEVELPYVIEFDCAATTTTTTTAPIFSPTSAEEMPVQTKRLGALGALALLPIMVLVVWASVVYKRKRAQSQKTSDTRPFDPPAVAAAAGTTYSSDPESASLPSPSHVPVFVPRATTTLPSYKEQCGSMAGPPIVDAVLVDNKDL
jgi:hypothetical protein